MRVDRRVALPEYTQQLVVGTRSVDMADPIEGVVGSFLDAMADKTPTQVDGLLQGHHNLTQLADAWPASA